MPIQPEDKAVATAMQMEIGHPAPFSEEECAKVSKLFVHGARDLSEISACPALVDLDLYACEVDLAPLMALPGLRWLRIACSRVGELTALRSVHALEWAEIIFTDVEDLSPLLSLPELRRGVVVGNPLSERSWDEVRPAMLSARTAEGRRAVWLFSGAEEWRFTRELWDKGLELCWAWFDGRLPLLVKPGVPRSMRIGVDYVMATPEDVLDTLGSGSEWDTDTLMRAVVRRVMGRSPRQAYNFRSSRDLGDAEDALEWIRVSRVDDSIKRALASFVSRFRDQIFYKEAPGLTALDERRHRSRLPAWFVNYRNTVAGVAPHLDQRKVALRVESFDAPLPGSGEAPRWFSLGQHGTAHPDHRPILDAGWFCVGVSVDDGPPVALVAHLGDDANEVVYAYAFDQVSEGRLPGPPLPVFENWASLLDAATAVRVGEEIFPAQS